MQGKEGFAGERNWETSPECAGFKSLRSYPDLCARIMKVIKGNFNNTFEFSSERTFSSKPMGVLCVQQNSSRDYVTFRVSTISAHAYSLAEVDKKP